MVYICSRIHFYEINDQTWYASISNRRKHLQRATDCSTFRFPQYLREKVQSCLALAWTFRAPVIQKTSPARLVAATIYDVLSYKTTQYTYVDFCAGAGGPTPLIEQHLNAQLASEELKSPAIASRAKTLRSSFTPIQNGPEEVKFVLTDLHPHIPDWTEASKKSKNLTFVDTPVDAANTPAKLIDNDGKKVFRLFNLAFHHFDNDLARDILRNTLETSDGFG